MKSKTILISILCFLSFVLLASCDTNTIENVSKDESHNKSENIVELTEKQYETAGVELGLVETKQISGTIKVNGVLDVPPQQLMSVSVPMGGFLRNTEMLQGTRVKKGQIIATIENLDFIQLQQDYLEAKSQFEFAQSDYKRQQELAIENVNAQKILQQAKTNFDTWNPKVNGLKEKLKLLKLDIGSLEEGNITGSVYLFAPITGYITEVNVNIGKFVNPSDVLFEIVDTEHLHAELIIFEKDVPLIKIGQKVRFTLANESSERKATVYLIGREISNSDRTIRIHCHIDEKDTQLLPGMYLKALVETGSVNSQVLPEEAILDFQGKKYIFIALQELIDGSNNHESLRKFIMQEIEVGNTEFGYTEVILPDEWRIDNQVVIRGSYALLSKMKNSDEDGQSH